MSARSTCPTCEGPTTGGVCPHCAFVAALAGVSAASVERESAASNPTAPEGYELLRQIGCGATAVVWLARERRLDRLVALKFIHASADHRLAQRLIREGQ